MRLIDLDDDRHCYVGNDGEYERWNIDSDVPTIDAVKVVRCKDCRWWDTSKEWTGCEGKGRCEIINLLVGSEDYCAYGEGKGEE